MVGGGESFGGSWLGCRTRESTVDGSTGDVEVFEGCLYLKELEFLESSHHGVHLSVEAIAGFFHRHLQEEER